MKIIDAAQQYFAEKLARPLPLLRIAGWTCCFIWLIGRLTAGLPAPVLVDSEELVDSEAVLCVPLGRGNPNGFRNPMPAKRSDEFRIAWVGDSSLHVQETLADGSIDHSFLPEHLVEGLDVGDGKKPYALMYQLSAGRLYDKYLCVLHALEQDPDLVILNFNPVWLCCNHAVTFWSNLYP